MKKLIDGIHARITSATRNFKAAAKKHHLFKFIAFTAIIGTLLTCRPIIDRIEKYRNTNESIAKKIARIDAIAENIGKLAAMAKQQNDDLFQKNSQWEAITQVPYLATELRLSLLRAKCEKITDGDNALRLRAFTNERIAHEKALKTAKTK